MLGAASSPGDEKKEERNEGYRSFTSDENKGHDANLTESSQMSSCEVHKVK